MSDDRPASTTHTPPTGTPGPLGAAATRRRGLEGRTIGGRYEVLRTVAAGANTLIADAHDLELNRTVTIKLVRPELSESDEFRRSFRRLMDETTAISHPNIAAVYDWGEEQIGRRGTVYAVVEYLSGGSLRDLFDRGRNLTPSQALMVGLEACRALDFAHRKGLVHTELTPSKLVFGDDRRLRIVDFGLARLLGEADWSNPSNVATHVARYASPEQAEGKPLDGRTDVYSLALVLIEAVTDNVPFAGDSTVATLSARVGKLMPVSADFGPLAAVLERAGRPEPADRYSASQFGRALVGAAEKLPRPTPIPILTTSPLFDNPAAMRAPDDPTGGIAKPPAEPGPALVPPPPSAPVPPTGATAEIAPDATPTGTAQPADSDGAASPSADTGGERATAAAAGVAAAAALGTTPDEATAAPTAEFDDLAELVERTPQPPAPEGEHQPATPTPADAGKAQRGAKVPEYDRTTRKGRRAMKKDAKARLAAANKLEKGQRKAAKRGDKAPAATQASSTAAQAPPSSVAPVPVVAAPAPPAAPPEPKRRRWVPWFAGIFLLAVLAGLGYVAWALFRTPTHEVPDVVGLDEAEALALVDEFEWEINTQDGRSDEFRELGQVIRTSPAAGDDLAEGSPLLIEVSEGPEYRTLPDLADVPLADAEAQLTELELVAGDPTTEFSETVPAGVVISASVDGPADRLLPGAEVSLVVSDGPQPRRVPDLRGLTVDEATQLLTDVGLELAVGAEVFDNEIPAGEIAVQSPAVNGTAERGSTVTAQVSKGPDLVTFPDLTGMTLPEIRQALADAGLQVGALLGSTQGTFVAASVDGEEVSAGDQVLRNSVVNLIVLVQDA